MRKINISALFVSLLLIMLTAISSTVNAAQDSSRPARPSNQPSLIRPYSDPNIEVVGKEGDGAHQDNPSKNIKGYFAYDYQLKVNDGVAQPFVVRASAGGKVRYMTDTGFGYGKPQPGCPVDVNPNQQDSQGLGLFIDHGNGWQTFYFHLSRYAVDNGAQVSQGQEIGTAGCTGTNTIHLHYDLRWYDPTTRKTWTYAPNFENATAEIPLDVAFVIDTTFSMADDIASVKTGAAEIIDLIKNFSPQNSRIAVMDFRDFPSRTGNPIDYAYQDILSFSFNGDMAKNAINSLNLGDGGDFPETQYCALMHAMYSDTCAGMGAASSIGVWRANSTKFVILLTDDSALDPEPVTGYTGAYVQTKSKEGGFELLGGESGFISPIPSYGIPIYPIIVGSNSAALEQANELAVGTGGKVFTAVDSTEVVGAITSAIEDVTTVSSHTDCPTITSWQGEYWANPALLGPPTLCRDDFDISFNWGLGSPNPAIPDDDFSMRWTRAVNFSSGNYRFHVLHDDGARIYVDNILVGDFWDTCCDWDSTDAQIQAGNHIIRLDVVENSGDAYAQLWWEKISSPVSSGADTAGVFRPSNGLLYLKNSNDTGFADMALNYGLPGDYPVVGDWDGNGTVTIGIYRQGHFYLRNENTIGFADVVFPFGQPGDQPIAGDWNGDGVDTIGVFRPSNAQFLLRNDNSDGPAELNFFLGNPGDVGIAGDWDGDGLDTTGVFRPSNGIIFMKNSNETGFADIALNYGIPGDKPVTGDWDDDGIDSIGVYRNGLFYLRNSNTIGFAEIIFGLGNPGDMPIAGNWDGLP